MKTKDVKIGSTYLCYIAQVLCRVVVVSVHGGNPDSRWSDERRTSFYVRREGEDKLLPKRRSAAALREAPKRRGEASSVPNEGNPVSFVETCLNADKREQAASLLSRDALLDAAREGAMLGLCDEDA